MQLDALLMLVSKDAPPDAGRMLKRAERAAGRRSVMHQLPTVDELADAVRHLPIAVMLDIYQQYSRLMPVQDRKDFLTWVKQTMLQRYERARDTKNSRPYTIRAG